MKFFDKAKELIARVTDLVAQADVALMGVRKALVPVATGVAGIVALVAGADSKITAAVVLVLGTLGVYKATNYDVQ